ncbi:cytochrome P450 [Nocardia tenerifensis]|uniref:Cytochrome P450 n=1 Tax=Nocardia tenerifensis TaxID=228006 RepID=A0A318KHY3_9NOCA|nr:cytochrome P450 [Nocardia tenerifensis]PXX71763.1 cytochrome P450 [Nocardia tenerifensis]
MTQAQVIGGLRMVGVALDLGLSPVMAGVTARRRWAMGLLERGQADARTVTRVRRLRAEFGAGPVELKVLGRRFVIVLDPADVERVLAQSPGPFTPANREKRATLGQFEPHAVLISEGPVRERRRGVNEAALDTASPTHRSAEPFARVIAQECGVLTESALRDGYVDAAGLTVAWWRIVRRIVLGDAARDDDRVTDDLWRLRSAGNWSYFSWPHRRRRDRFLEQLYRYQETAAPDTLLGALAAAPGDAATDPIGQVPHWLFAFDAAGIALTRTLALLAAHPRQYLLACSDSAEPEQVRLRPYLRASMLESLRLWPTTPALLRDTTETVTWRDNGLRTERGAAVLIAAPAFHRDPELLPFAHSFAPDIWLDGRAEQYPQLVPFSAGPAACPGRSLVLFTTSTLLAHLLTAMEFRQRAGRRLAPDAPLPMTLNNFGLSFTVRPRALGDDTREH